MTNLFKKVISILLSVIIISSFLASSISTYAVTTDGDTPDVVSVENIEYYALYDADDLYWFSDYVNEGNTNANALLMTDIIVNDGSFDENGNYISNNGNTDFVEWNPIGKDIKYNGIFDGQNFSISGLYYNNTAKSAKGGFIITTNENSIIKNLTIKNSYICAYNYVGGIVGDLRGCIYNCENNSYIIGISSYTGGICGMTLGNNSEIINCANTGYIKGSHYVGGITGANYSNIICCYNTGTISGYDYVGGIFGSYSLGNFDCRNATINCYNQGNVTSRFHTGGICAQTSGSIFNCYNTGNITSTDQDLYCGGICGYPRQAVINGKRYYNQISYCYNSSINKNSIGTNDFQEVPIVESYQKNETAFHSGEVAYLLGQNEFTFNNVTYNGDVWGQDLKSPDSYPELFANPVIISDTDGSYVNKHTEGTAVKENEIAPTCTEKGSYDLVVYCTECSTEMSREKIITSPTGHHHKAILTNYPTCLREGYTTYKCPDCGDTYTSDFIDKLEHNFVNGRCTECSNYIESKHNYYDNTDTSWTIEYPYADSISITFSPLTETEFDTDFIIIYDSKSNEVGRFSGTELSGRTITVNDSIATIRITSNSENNYYGFSVTDISPDYNILVGDINLDGTVKINDATLLQKYLTDLTDFNDAQLKIADSNNNGRITIEDATLIQKYLAGLTDDKCLINTPLNS